MNRKTGEMILTETDSIRQSISDILTTPVGSRVMRRDYGSLIFELIDRPFSHGLMLQITAAALIAIKKWEPRFFIQKFEITEKPQSASIYAEIIGITKTGERAEFHDVKIH